VPPAKDGVTDISALNGPTFNTVCAKSIVPTVTPARLTIATAVPIRSRVPQVVCRIRTTNAATVRHHRVSLTIKGLTLPRVPTANL
jgi:hypothetical protein